MSAVVIPISEAWRYRQQRKAREQAKPPRRPPPSPPARGPEPPRAA